MDIEDYQEKDISGKILYLSSLFKGIKDHLKILNEMDELTGVESQMFTILNDFVSSFNDLYATKIVNINANEEIFLTKPRPA